GYAGTLQEETVAEAKGVYTSTSAGAPALRTPAHLAAYTDGLEVLDPGIVPVQSWRPEFDGDAEYDLGKPGVLGVVARVP
ncbi:SAM-dependent methyltransferase, partial [Planobispora rosea]